MPIFTAQLTLHANADTKVCTALAVEAYIGLYSYGLAVEAYIGLVLSKRTSASCCRSVHRPHKRH